MLKNLRINESALLAAATTPMYYAYARRVAEEIVEAAKNVYRMKEVRGNEHRRSATSPPRYLESFQIERVGRRMVVKNVDPGAMWVEFGSHAGGKTLVLKYRPMGTALDIVSNRR
jgi:hypothetical protein